MQVVVCTDFRNAVVRDVPRPTPGAEEVIVVVDRVQLSVTECRLFRGHEVAHIGAVSARLSEGPAKLFGHEFCGRVVEVGTGVEALRRGDRVYAPGKIECGECAYCSAEYEHLCEDKRQIGYEIPGGLAEFIVLPASPLRRLPDEVSDAAGAALQPLSSALLAVHDADIATGDVVAVLGAGVMGYQCGQLALDTGASRVVVVDIVPEKLAAVERQGMISVDARYEELVDRVSELTNGTGADVVFEAVGGEQDHVTDGSGTLAQAFCAVRRGGTVVQVGHVEGDVELTARAIRAKSVSWKNPTHGVRRLGPNVDSGEFAAALVADGRVSIEEYVTHELDGLESFEEAVDITLNKEAYEALGPAQIVVSA